MNDVRSDLLHPQEQPIAYGIPIVIVRRAVFLKLTMFQVEDSLAIEDAAKFDFSSVIRFVDERDFFGHDLSTVDLVRGECGRFLAEILSGLDAAIAEPLKAFLIVADEFFITVLIDYLAKIPVDHQFDLAVRFDLIHFLFSG